MSKRRKVLLVVLVILCLLLLVILFFPQPIFGGGNPEFCELSDNPTGVEQAKAGIDMTDEYQAVVSANIPPVESDFKIVGDRIDQSKMQIVLMGVGYTDEEIEKKFFALVKKLGKNFSGVNVQFQYLQSSVDVDFIHLGQLVVPEDYEQANRLLQYVRAIAPKSKVLFLINTEVFIGTKIGEIAIVSGEDKYVVITATHEIGHLLGLDDGYWSMYQRKDLPNNALFFNDSKTPEMEKAIKELGKEPLFFQVGTCLGEPIYTHYIWGTDIMGDYIPLTPNMGIPASWLRSGKFTPLQVVMMNEYIRGYLDN